MKKEEKAEIIIYSWLRTRVKEIYFNRKNKINAPVFKIVGKDKRARTPDLIIKTFKNKYYVIEVKPSNNTKDITQGKNQLLERYWIPYSIGVVEYLIDTKRIKIEGFLFATDMSIFGQLYSKDEFLLDNLEDANEHKINVVSKFKIIPRYEYSRTKDFNRSLFSQLKEFRFKKPELIQRTAALGILINHIPEPKNLISKPYIFIVKKIKNRWGQHYWAVDEQ